jgi:hypothetical protein
MSAISSLRALVNSGCFSSNCELGALRAFAFFENKISDPFRDLRRVEASEAQG